MSEGYLYEHIPWAYITHYHEGVVVHHDGTYQRTFAFSPPDIESTSPVFIEQLGDKFNDAIKRLGGGWGVQYEATRFEARDYKGGAFTRLAPYLIDAEREAAFLKPNKHFITDFFITFVYKAPDVNIQKMKNIFIKSAERLENSDKEDIEKFVHESGEITGILQNYLYMTPLTNQQTAAYLHNSVSMNRHPVRFPTTAVLLNRLLPDQALENTQTLKLGDYFIPVLTINDFPETTYPTILSDLNAALVEYRWVTRYICLDKEDGKKKAGKIEKAHRGNQQTILQALFTNISGQQSKQINRGALVKEEDAAQVGGDIETDLVSLGLYSANVMVWDKDYDKAHEKLKLIKDKIQKEGFICREETHNAFAAWKGMMPGQMQSNIRELPVVSSTLSHIVPLTSIWEGMQENNHAKAVTGVGSPHIICETRDGTPFYLNLNPSDVGHAAIWGPTGAGKSTLLNLLETQFFKYPGARVIVFDKGKSARQPCAACGGLYYEPASDSENGVVFQPLRDLETQQDKTFAVEFIQTLLAMQKLTPTPAMGKAVMDAVLLMEDIPKKSRTLTTFVQNCNYIDESSGKNTIYEHLQPYLLTGQYGKIFDNDASELSDDTSYLVIEMEYLMNLGESATAPALVYLFYFIEKKFDGSLTMLVLDEAWLFLQNPLFQKKINEWLKTLRKKNVFVVFATQDVMDAVKSPLFSTIAQQCLTKIYLADPQAADASMYEAYSKFGLDDTEIHRIASAEMKKDYYYTSPLGARLFQLGLGPVTLALIAGADQTRLDKLVEWKKPRGYEYAEEILNYKETPYKHLLPADYKK
ncbi:MAG: ATP-binding protein [Spirochaetaceae bacterium]|jgi:type IV secretion system protein VirB4|nr:ATP-binding protein [Spirochaetaceae bacterium]